MRKILIGLAMLAFATSAFGASQDLSPLMPPPMDQKWPLVPSCGSCTFGYALKTYYEGLDRGWSVLTPNHQFAPNYLHNQVQYQEGLGINEGERNCWIMANRGICTLADEPYTTDQLTWPTAAQCQAGLNYQNDLIGGLPYGSIVGYDSVTRKPNLTNIRAALDQGKVLGMYFVYFNGFETLSSATNYVYYSVYQSGTQTYHWITIVGYDDTRTDGTGHVGALKVQNSFGATWADHGYGWIAYDALNYASMPVANTQGKFYYLKNLPATYVSTLSARISLNHPLVAGTRISVGVGDIAAPSWTHTFYDFTPDYFTDLADPVHANFSTVVDLTGASAFWPPSAARPWWVKVEDPLTDGLTGTITEFSVTQGGTTFSTKTPLPVSIPDTGSAYAYIYGNRPPVITSAISATPNPAKVGQTVTFSAAATDPDGDALTYRWTFGDSATQTGATTSHAYAAPGVYPVTVTATDGGGLFATTSASVTVTALATPVVITTASPLPSGTVGTAYSLQFTASGGTPPYHWSSIDPLGLGALPPPGLVFSNGGLLLGTPKTAGTYSFMIGCNDSASGSASATVTITINSAPVAPSIQTQPSNATVIAGQTATFSVAATGTALTYQWFRNGVNIAGATGASNTTPATTVTDSGSTYYVVVKNTLGNVTSATATLTVNPAVQPVTITTVSPLLSGTVGSAYRLQFTATGGTAPYQWSSIDPLGLGALPPPGMLFSTGGLLLGTPKTAGTYSFMVGCRASSGGSATATVTITINAAKPLTVTALQGSVSFVASGRDTASVSGTIPGSSLLATNGQSISLNLGGVTQSFVLDAKGHGKSANGIATVSTKGGRTTFTAKLHSGSFKEAFGLSASHTSTKSRTTLTVYLEVGGETYASDVNVSCLTKTSGGSFKK